MLIVGFFEVPEPTKFYTRKFVGSVSCVYETDIYVRGCGRIRVCVCVRA